MEERLFQRLLARLRTTGTDAAAVVADAANKAHETVRTAGRTVGEAAASAVTYVGTTAEELIDGAKTASIFFRVTPGLRQQIKTLAAAENRTIEELLTEAVLDLLEKRDRLIKGPDPQS